MPASQAADRFSIFSHEALTDFHLLASDVSKFHVNKDKDYSNGILYRAAHRQPAHSRNP